MLELGKQFHICVDIKLRVEWHQRNLLDFEGWDAVAYNGDLEASVRLNCDQEIEATYVDDSE